MPNPNFENFLFREEFRASIVIIMESMVNVRDDLAQSVVVHLF
jgi:hypothetical protein